MQKFRMSKQNDGFNKSVAREEGHAQWSTSKEPYRDKTTIFVLVWEEKNRKGRRVGGISKNKNENKIEWPSNKNNKTTSVVLCTESILIHRSKRAFGECIYYFYDHHPMSIQQHQITDNVVRTTANKSQALKQQLCWNIIQYRFACCCCCYFCCFGRICHLIHVIKSSQNMSSSTTSRTVQFMRCTKIIIKGSLCAAHTQPRSYLQVEERQRKSRHIHKNHFHFHEFSADFRLFLYFCFVFVCLCKKTIFGTRLRWNQVKTTIQQKTARTFWLCFFCSLSQQIPRLAITSPSPRTKRTQHTKQKWQYEMEESQ